MWFNDVYYGIYNALHIFMFLGVYNWLVESSSKLFTQSNTISHKFTTHEKH